MNKFSKFSKHKPKPRPAGHAGGAAPGGPRKNFRGKPKGKSRPSSPPPPREVNYEETGREAAYLKELVETETPVVVVMRGGEEIHGFVRYYDRDIFSVGPADGGPKMFLRKDSVRYLYEKN